MKIVIVMIMLSLMGCKATIVDDDFCYYREDPDCELKPQPKK